MRFKVGEVVICPRGRGVVESEAIPWYGKYSNHYWIRVDLVQALYPDSELRLDDPFEQFVRETRFAAGLDKD